MKFPKKYFYNTSNHIVMKKNLKVSKASNIVCMSNCPKAFEWQCGIAYRTY